MRFRAKHLLMLFLTLSISVNANNFSIEKCVTIANDLERLSCYDSIFNQTNASEEENSELILALPSKNLAPENFGLKEKITQENAEQVTDIVLSVSNLTNGRVKINLENGQIWVTSDAPGRLRIKQQTHISITESRFGGYVLKAKDQKGFVRVKRIK